MTPEDLDNALKDLARTFVREVKQQEVPLRVNRELAVDIIRTARYQHRDEISLILEARAYIKGRLPVRDRATAVASLLQGCCAHEQVNRLRALQSKAMGATIRW